MWVENRLDEVRVGVKGQSNSEIARIPRNSFRASLETKCNGGRALIGLGLSQRYQTQTNSEFRIHVSRESGGGG
jgi:hypothetical protein